MSYRDDDSMRRLLAIVAFSEAAMAGAFRGPKNNLRPQDLSGIPLQTAPANGCREYWLTWDGRFHNGGGGETRIRRDETVFYCHASNDKNAKRKFDNFKKKLL